MPYRGKPSQGCANCRKRKIKCDQRPGACLNCEKSNRECAGYRNQSDLMFLDQTQQVLNRARGTKSPSSASRQTSTRSSSSTTLPVLSRSQTREDVLVVFKQPCDLESQAIAFYYQNFAIKEDSQARWVTRPAFSAAPSHNALYQSMLALGYAGLSQCASLGQLRLQARGFAETAYIETVRAVKFAVNRPEKAGINGTLLAVHLMAMYETTAQRRTDAELETVLPAWSNHIHGAAALLAARGNTQLGNPQSMQLFNETIILLCMDCMKQGLPLPENVSKMYTQAKQRVSDRESPASRCRDLVVEFCNFYGQVRSRQVIDYQIILARAQDLDDEAQAVFEYADHTSLYETVQNKTKESSRKSPGIQFPAYHHKYPNFHAAERWNGCRSMRILLNQMIRSIILLGMTRRPPLFDDHTHTRLLQRSTDTLRTLQGEVMSSLPQYLDLEEWEVYDDCSDSDDNSKISRTCEGRASATDGPCFLWNSWPNTREAYQDISPRSPTTMSSSEESATTTQLMSSMRPPLIKIGGGSNLPWVLFTLGATDIATEPLKRWLVARLRYIGEKMSVRQALVLAVKLEKGEVGQAWYRDYAGRRQP